MLALSIRQPFAELILRGIKTIEYRSRPTRIIGERFWIYASKGGRPESEPGSQKRTIWSGDLDAAGTPPDWMLELAQQIKLIKPGTLLPRGVIVGSAVIERCEPAEGSGVRDQGSGENDAALSALNPEPCALSPFYAWHLTGIERITTLRKPMNHPQPVWFKPF